MPIEAAIICDSISNEGHRLTTFKLRYPKFIHAEFMTHRVFSRNASSSRAVPTERLIAEVRDPALRAAPVFWGKNQPGMQAAVELEGEALAYVQDKWDQVAQFAATVAGLMGACAAHKQIVNRIMEPFTHINVVVTATEYMNFFGLRLDAAAQPEMRMLAEAMWAAYGESRPLVLEPGEWHLPFVDEATFEENETMQSMLRDGDENGRQRMLHISTARCARVSYESFETGRRSTVEEDLRLFAKLFPPGQAVHASPAEHQATPDSGVYRGTQGEWDGDNRRQWGNFCGWRQYRKMLPGENMAPLPKARAEELAARHAGQGV